MAHFGDEGIGVEHAAEFNEVFAVLLSEAEGPGELHDEASKTLRVDEGTEAFVKLFDEGGVEIALMSKGFEHSGREAEGRVMLDFAGPEMGDLGTQGSIETAVDLNDVKEAAEKVQGVETAGFWRGVDDSIPMRKRPTSGSGTNRRRGERGRHIHFAFCSPLEYVSFWSESRVFFCGVFFEGGGNLNMRVIAL
jgi:hypothetical protein